MDNERKARSEQFKKMRQEADFDDIPNYVPPKAKIPEGWQTQKPNTKKEE